MKIAVVGTGYVGLVSGVCLAAKQHHVTCVDLDPNVVETLGRGIPHIYEQGLEDLLKTAIRDGYFTSTTDLEKALSDAELVLIAVGTPSTDGAIDLSFVRSVSQSIGDYIGKTDRHISVIVKSTVVPGTTDTVVLQELQDASGKSLEDFGLGMNPEFLREGCAIEDFMNPDRIVFGHEDQRTLERLRKLYAPWDCDKVEVNTRTAELIKYANNALLAVQISAINEIANLAASVGGIDIMDVHKGVSLDKRWSPIQGQERISPDIISYLIPGCGFGGSCFPKDVQALRTLGQESGLSMQLLQSVLDVNEAQPSQVTKILEKETGGLNDKNVLLLGLAFKPDTDDVRETASLPIARDLLASGAKVVAHDPLATDHFKSLMGDDAQKITFVQNWQQEVSNSDIVIIATKWTEYERLSDLSLEGQIVFDARRLLSHEVLPNTTYLTIGRRL